MLLKVRFLGLVFPVLLAGAWPMAAQAATAPGLGSAANFAVLSAAPGHGGAVTCTGGMITGDVGSSGLAASVVQTGCTITGAIVAPVSARVVADFNTAFAAFAAIPCGTTLTGTLAGLTLTPGVYCVDSVAKTGILTLTGSGSWIFKVSGALTGTNFSVVTSNPCNVTWQAAAAATMTTSQFAGTILAGAAITLTGGTFNGNALASAAVTITGTNLVGCAGGKAKGNERKHCNQGVGNGPEGCDPGNSNNRHTSNDELGGTPGDPGRQPDSTVAANVGSNLTSSVTVEAKGSSAPTINGAVVAKGNRVLGVHGKSHAKLESKTNSKSK